MSFTYKELKNGDLVVCHRVVDGSNFCCIGLAMKMPCYSWDGCQLIGRDSRGQTMYFYPEGTSVTFDLVIRPDSNEQAWNILHSVFGLTEELTEEEFKQNILKDLDAFGSIVYQKEEAKEMTVEEISKALGYEVKVVKG